MDDDMDNLYRAEQRTGKISELFSVLGICIACLGLFGLVYFYVEQRTKEIGVRKVLGADVPNIIFLISKDYAKLLLIALLISSPPAYFVMNKWLQNFAYRVSIGFSVFILTGFLTFFIALLTIGYQSIKAALTNPTEALRFE